MNTKQLISAIKKTVPSKNSLPIVENVHLDTDKIHLTDLDIHVMIPYKSGVSACVSAKRFVRILETMPSHEVTVGEGNKVSFSCGVEEIKMNGEDSENFPSLSLGESGAHDLGTLLNSDFASIQIACQHTSDDELRIPLLHVYVSQEIVGTNGHTLFHKPRLSNLTEDFLLMPKTFQILKCFGDQPWKVRVHSEEITHYFFNGVNDEDGAISEMETFEPAGKAITRTEIEKIPRQLMFESIDGVLVYQRYENTPYCNWLSVVPTESSRFLMVKREELIAGVKRAKEYSSAVTKQIRISCNSHQFVSSEDIDFGAEYKKELESGIFTGEPIDIGFNAEFVLDTLAQIDDETVMIRMNTEKQAAVFNSHWLIMPVRLNA